ncbi:MAG TPA: type II toxin-antitoxin system VapC family toxin [Vicinamibacteria bacterium]|nr:type II toxin-antitoxin system VapC family toxin [Vicinamibacteria bacterium]
MSFLLDTNVVCELRKRRRCHPRVAAWFAGLDDQEIHLSVLVIGELRQGVERLRGRDPRSAAALDRWLSAVVMAHGDRIVAVDRSVAEEWGRLGARRALPPVDGLLAATARVHGLTLVTRNVKHVEPTGVSCLNPFEPA